MSRDDADLELSEGDATAMLPPCERETLRHSVDPDEVEGWEETTQIDEPWSASTKEGIGGIGLALPAPFVDDDGDDDELTDFALTIEPMTPRQGGKRTPTPEFRPQRPLPPALAFRPNVGTTPPPRRLPPAQPAITWRPSSEAEQTSATTIEAPRTQLASQPIPAPVMMSAPAPRPEAVLPEPRSRLRSWAKAIAAMGLGAGAAVFVASLDSEPAPPAASAAVVSVPIFIPIAIPAATPVEAPVESPADPIDTANAAADETAKEPTSEPPRASTGDLDEGMSALAANHLDVAERALRRALHSDPRRDEAVRGLGLVAESQGKTHTSLYWYRRYLRRVPKGVHSESVRQRIESLSGRTR